MGTDRRKEKFIALFGPVSYTHLMNMNRFRLHIFRYPFKGIFLLSALFSCEGKGFPLFDELDKNFRRGESVVERAVVVERKAVIIGNGIEFIITHFSADELLRQRQSIELFLVEHIKIFLAVIADETVVELYVVPDEDVYKRQRRGGAEVRPDFPL